jgi:hypothetical protein
MQRGHLSSIREAMDPCSCSPSDRGCAETRKRSVDAGSKKGDWETGNPVLRNAGGLRLWPRDELAAFVSMDDVSCHIENASSRHKPVPARSCLCRVRCHRSRAAPEHSALAQLCRLLRCGPAGAVSWKCRRRPAQCSGRKQPGSVTQSPIPLPEKRGWPGPVDVSHETVAPPSLVERSGTWSRFPR